MPEDSTERNETVQAALDEISQQISKSEFLSTTEIRRSQIRQLIQNTINGDHVRSHLAIDANLGENKKGCLVYVLTNLRLIKIEIDEKEVRSVSYPIDTMIGMERKLIAEDGGPRSSIQLSFQNGSFGLRYAPEDQAINNFFQHVDQFRLRALPDGRK